MSPFACFNVYVAQGMCMSPFACIKAYGAQDLSRHFVDKISLCTLWYIDSCELSTWSVRHLLLHLVFFSPEPRDSLFLHYESRPTSSASVGTGGFRSHKVFGKALPA